MNIDLPTYLKTMQQEKFRSVIIHHDQPEVLSAFLKQAKEALNGKWLNLLEHFKSNATLIQQLDYYDVHKLKELLQAESEGQTYLFIDQADFLLGTYDHRELGHFFRLIEKQWNNFYKGTECTLVFGLMSSDELEEQNIVTPSGASRILSLSELSAFHT